MTRTRGPLGDLTRAPDGTYTVRFERFLHHPPDRVWTALTDPQEARRWFVEITLEPQVGGHLQFDFGDEGQVDGEVLAWDPPRALEHSWVEAGRESRVRWELAPTDGGTRLILTHSRLTHHGAYQPHDYGAGWHDFLGRLPVHLDGGEMPTFGEGFDELSETYRVEMGGG